MTEPTECKHYFGQRGNLKHEPRTCRWCGLTEPSGTYLPSTLSAEVFRQHGKFGPAMKALPTDRQRNFVIAMLTLGDGNYTAAAQLAGYSSESRKGLNVLATRLAHDEAVQAAIAEEAQKRLNGAVMMGVKTLLDILGDGEQDPKNRLRAVELLFNRTGFHAKTEHKLVVEQVTDEEMVARIRSLSANLGLDAAQLLGTAGVTIDAEYQEVEQC